MKKPINLYYGLYNVSVSTNGSTKAEPKPFKELSQNPLFIKLSESNKKLIPNKETKFLIFNLPSKITCPFATEHCRQFCYAVKAETAYPACLPSRLKHLEESKENNFVERMIFTIESYLLKPSYKNAKKIIVRIHESGDFYNQIYANKWLEIAEHFKADKRIVFMAYTKSLVFFCNSIYSDIRKPIPKNMIIRFSIWDDTHFGHIALNNFWGFPTYSAVDKFTKNIKSQNRCLCRDCAKCGKCWSKTKSIICEIH